MSKRKSAYSQSYDSGERIRLAEQVLDLISTMGTVKACKTAGVPVSTFTDWVKTEETWTTKYACARVDYIENMAQQVMDISDEKPGTNEKGSTDTGAVQHQRLRVDSRKWLLSKLAPKRYGERLTVAGDEAAPLKVEQITRIVVDPANDDKGKEGQ